MAKKSGQKTGQKSAPKTKKFKEVKFDGLNPKEKANIRKALRQVWSWTYSRKLVVNRCLADNGFSKCELCKNICAKVYVDHIQNVGEVDAGIIERMFVTSDKMQGLCKKCHDKKTKKERAAKSGPEENEESELDFY